MFERYRELQERRTDGESPESGFTLIELLIVIVVLAFVRPLRRVLAVMEPKPRLVLV